VGFPGPHFAVFLKKTNTTMNQRMSIITIGTDNLQAMRQFYVEKFGWQPVAENKDILFFKLNGLRCGRKYLGSSLESLHSHR
jgi:catechol 2,3-dioxygenase-like lactoylglutathione lyase family enzyme